MRTIPLAAAATLALAFAGVTMAASPAPSTLPSAAPSKAPTTTTTKAPAPSGGATTASGSTATQTWTASINPLNVTTGTATLAQGTGGTGILTMSLKGLRPDVRWTINVDAGTVAKPLQTPAAEIAFRSGLGVEKVSNSTVRIHLTASEMKAFTAARAASGVVILVSDGVNQSAATFKA